MRNSSSIPISWRGPEALRYYKVIPEDCPYFFADPSSGRFMLSPKLAAALKVPEIWRYDGEALKVLILGSNGKYRQKSKSLAFPKLPLEPFAQDLGKLDSRDEVTLIREFTEWVNRVAKGGE